MKAFAKIAVAAAGAVLVLAGPAGAWETKNYDIKEVRENNKVYKIHGDNRGKEDYECKSFEGEMGDEDKAAAILHAKLATYAYQDGSTAYHYTTQDGTAVELTRKQACHETEYEPLPADKVRELVPDGSGNLHVEADGSITGKSRDGLNAVLLKGPKGQIVISYRGTNVNGQDIGDDAKQAAVAKIVPQQYKDAAQLLQTVMASTKDQKTPIICDGHSLGGGEVTYAMAATDLDGRVTGYTYNAAGLSESTVESLDKDQVLAAAEHITNFRNKWDPVSYVGYHLGPTYEVTTTGPYEGDNHNLKNDHSIAHLTENMIAATGGTLVPKTVPTEPQETDAKKPDGRQDGPDGPNGPTGPASPDNPIEPNSSSDPDGPTRPNADTGQHDGAEGVVGDIVQLIREVTGWSLDEKTTGDIVDVIVDAIKNGGGKLEQYKQKIGDMLPGDSSKQTLDTLLDKVVRGDFNDIKTTIQDFGKAVATDYATQAVIDSGVASGVSVMDIQKVVGDLVNQGYQAGTSFVAVLNQAVNGGCFGGNGSGGSQNGGGNPAESGGFNLGSWLAGKLSGISPAGVWGTIKAKIQTVGLQKLEQFAVKQLNSWINKYPTVKKWLTDIFGIDGQSIVNGLKNIWGVLSGNGTISEKLSKLVTMAQHALCDMARHALQYGLGKLKGWLSGIASKWVAKITNWVVNKIYEWFGIKLPTNLIQKVQAWLNAQVGKGVTKVVDVLQDAGTSIIDKFDPNVKKTSTGNKSVYNTQQQTAPAPVTP